VPVAIRAGVAVVPVCRDVQHPTKMFCRASDKLRES
jgi:hypothetical protein